MKLKYRQVNLVSPFSRKQKLLRPIIPLSLKYRQRSMHYEALIDSGADFCIFPMEIAEKLNINFKNTQRIYFFGATGEPILGLVSKVTLQIGEIIFNSKVVFADLHNKAALLGQYGFFDKARIRFDLKKEEIEINP